MSATPVKFRPAILPPYARRSKSLEASAFSLEKPDIPILYLRDISTGDFGEALSALLGMDAPNLPASTISRLKDTWSDEHRKWSARDLSAKRYVYVWADGSGFSSENADMFKPDWRKKPSAFWWRWARRRRARRRLSASPMAPAKAPITGVPCCSI